MHKTFIMIKPDALKRGIVGKVMTRLEDKGLTLLAMKMVTPTLRKAQSLYKEHKGKSFYDALTKYTSSSPVIVMVVGGIGKTHEQFILTVKHYVIGNPNCQATDSGTIRGDFGISCTNRNVIHSSASIKDAQREIRIFFSDREIMKYKRADHEWLYSELERKDMAIVIDPTIKKPEITIGKDGITVAEQMTVKDHIIENRRKKIEAEKELIVRKNNLLRIKEESYSQLRDVMAECVGMKADISIYPDCRESYLSIKGLVKMGTCEPIPPSHSIDDPFADRLVDLYVGKMPVAKLRASVSKKKEGVRMFLEIFNAKSGQYDTTYYFYDFVYEAVRDKPFECENLCTHARTYLVRFFEQCVVEIQPEVVEQEVVTETDGF